jgi:hypothetical protein
MADTSDMKTELKNEPRENQEMEGGEEVSPDNPRLDLAPCLLPPARIDANVILG